jgi:hypothetical protein
MDDNPRDVLALPRLSGRGATAVAETEYRRFADVPAVLTPADWSRPTECPAWDVRLLVTHVLGAAEANASPPEMLRLRRGRRGRAIEVDPVSESQVRERRDLEPDVLRWRFDRAVPAAVAWRARWSRLAGGVPMRAGAPVHETWPVRYLMPCATSDRRTRRPRRRRHGGRLGAAARATRRADARRAGRRQVRGRHRGLPRRLGHRGVCRTLSGRANGQGLLSTPVPF